ncbi:MAG: CRISPR-associated endonuclease Cas1 [Chloroflexota bacterium]|nr:CRISPR-associated endonuclease Cas1 [Chloroflexota bacterium]
MRAGRAEPAREGAARRHVVEGTPSPTPLAARGGVLVLSGYGIRVAVERGHLLVADGVGRERREGRLARATCKLRRLVVLGHAGTISFEALRWLHDVGAAFVQLGADGQVIAATAPPGLDDPRLRRAQALAPTNGAGLAIARDLLRGKLRGQAGVLAEISDSDGARAVVEQALGELERGESVGQLRSAEAKAANAYWGAWSPIPMPWARKDAARVPEHWRTVGPRSSPLTGSPRSAANPANALLNYLYAMLEAEARIALLAVGLDPGLGVLHADLKARDSLALDLMEAVRPKVDAYVLGLLRSHTFAARDFFETRQAACRVLPPLTHRLAETAPAWAKAVAPVAEGVSRDLFRPQGRTAQRDQTLPTLLTGANRSTGRKASRRHPEPSHPSVGPELPPACGGCGVVLDDPRRAYCDVCLPERRGETAAIFANAGPETLAKLRAKGTDPAHGGEAACKRGRRNAEHARAAGEWERANGDREPDADFARDVLPELQSVPLGTLMEATGLSLRYCSLIRRGLRVPHRRHWAALARLGIGNG